MFSNLSDKAKIALFTAVGMICFLFAGALVYSFSISENITRGTTSNTNDSSTSIEKLYQNLTETDSGNIASMVKEVNQPEIQNGQVIDDRWVLYITGSVKTPGIYRLPEDARVYELVEAAGGFTATANVVAVNMAARLQDGDHLHVPLMGENNRNQSGAGTVAFTQDRQRDNAGTNSQSSSKGPLRKSIDLNRASAQELQMLPGVGPAMSERIIHYRNQNGGFKQVSDLINVSGIGAKKLESIEQYVFVR